MPVKNQIETLKNILESSLNPVALDSHPWTQSLIIAELLQENPGLKSKSPGQQLVIAITSFFARLIPAAVPRRGRQVDPDWARFGILAARYFAPLVFGAPAPDSLSAAWERVDESILLFVFGKPASAVPQERKDVYTLTAAGTKASAPNVLEEWAESGLKQLLQALAARERSLSKSMSVPAVIVDEEARRKRSTNSASSKRFASSAKPVGGSSRAVFIVLLILLVLIALAGFKAYRVYALVEVARNDAVYARKLLAESESQDQKFKNAGSAIALLRRDFAALKDETEPFFWAGSLLKWVPTNGGDLASASDLSTLMDSLLSAADQSYQTFAPLFEKGSLATLSPAELTQFMKDNHLKLSGAQSSVRQAQAARARLTLADLSPEVQDLILNDVDPLLQILGDTLAVAVEFPEIMGTDNGGKTYLLLVENEDELRPTGGFITAASTVVIENGSVSEFNFVNSSHFDNWAKLYPPAPWQLKDYMNSSVLIFRDANWFTHYPTTATYAEYLYSYTNDRTLDGVIAFDQHLLVELLQVTGPIKVQDTPQPVDAGNVIQYMRQAKSPTPADTASDWNKKAFLNGLTRSLLEKIFRGEVKWETLFTQLLKTLNEHHILLQVNNADLTSLLARYHWDGAVRPGDGDFLMAVDSNIGFNKTNAVVESEIAYDVDLTNLSKPTGALVVSHKNNAKQQMVCQQWLKTRLPGEENYPITDCYWNYLRIYKPAGTSLMTATPQVVPDLWMINQQKNPGQVDVLQEDISGVQAFGTLQVVPVGEVLPVSFKFALPTGVVKSGADGMTYTLRIQKQPGTLAVPLTLRVHLANNALIKTAPPNAVIQENNVLYQIPLETDVDFTLVFTVQ